MLIIQFGKTNHKPVDMSLEGVVEGDNIKTRISTINGNYSPSDWYIMDDSDELFPFVAK